MDLQPEPSHKGFPVLIYGTKSGGIGAIELTQDEAIVLWECDFTFDGKSPVSHLKVAQLREEQNHIVISRDDGTIEIFTYSERQQASIVFECRELDE
jgi:hypothetical protein